jgi:lysophospholipase L1-like esterase
MAAPIVPAIPSPFRGAILPLLAACLIAVATAAAEEGVADRATYLAGLSAAMAVEWPKNRCINLVCHGHSVPTGYFKTPVVDTFNAYPHLLHRGLKERFPDAVINVIVTGIGGEQSEAGAARFAADVLIHRPDLVTIDYALNDRGIGLARAKAAWTAMIAAAREAHVPVILLTPTPDQSARLDDPADPLNQHAEQIRRLAAEHHVGLVDSLAAFKARIAAGTALPELMSQVNHPNRQGHELVAAGLLAWFP